MRWQRRLVVNRIPDKLWCGSDAMQALVDPPVLPCCQFHLVDPLMDRVAVGALVELPLEADSIRPYSRIHRPYLVESVAVAIDHERIVPILRGTDPLHVPLDTVPGTGRQRGQRTRSRSNGYWCCPQKPSPKSHWLPIMNSFPPSICHRSNSDDQMLATEVGSW